MVKEIMAEEEAWKAKQEVARDSCSATSRTAVEKWKLSSMPHGRSYDGQHSCRR
jgi:hypothetical protein